MISKDQGNKDVKLTLKKIINLIPHLNGRLGENFISFFVTCVTCTPVVVATLHSFGCPPSQKIKFMDFCRKYDQSTYINTKATLTE